MKTKVVKHRHRHSHRQKTQTKTQSQTRLVPSFCQKHLTFFQMFSFSQRIAREIRAFTENSQKCVTFGYYIIARFASWGPSVPLGGFRPPGIGGCSLTMEQKRVEHVHNGTSYNNLYLIAFGTTGAIKIKRQEIGDSYSAIRYSLSWFPAFVKHIWHFFRCLLF